jgi:hypothetical protein
MLPGSSRKTFGVTTCSVISTTLAAISMAAIPYERAAADDAVKTATPIKHLIVLIGAPTGR